jgi:16S rRNA (uracil1498-N3)-methyltransferase
MGSAGAEQGEVGARRFYAPTLKSHAATSLSLGEDAARHARVLRLAAGDTVELFDGAGGTCRAHVSHLARNELVCRLDAPRFEAAPQRVVLVACVPKAHKLDDVVRMTAELGVAEIRLALSSRSVPRTDAEKLWAKRERLEKIAIEAVRQSENAWLPTIYEPRELSAQLADAPAHATKLALVERSAAPFDLPRSSTEVWVVVGPEGGLSGDDRTVLDRFGCISAGIGRSILRSETACVVGVALVLDRLRRQH